ncbi:MAG: hypothetical protein K9G13_01305 [Aquiluna sp.]|nr:hypothetical protein [Aquiluna sp.]MCF8545166.1 hypothetical protein [Aquiluna sp.]
MTKLRFASFLSIPALVLAGCSVGPAVVEPSSSTQEFDSFIETANYRSELIPSLVLDKVEFIQGDTVPADVVISPTGGLAPSSAWLLVEAAPELGLAVEKSPGWVCETWGNDTAKNAFSCFASKEDSEQAIASGISIEISAPDASGLFGVSVQSGYGDVPVSLNAWSEIPGLSDSTRRVLKVISRLPHVQPQSDVVLAKSAGLRGSHRSQQEFVWSHLDSLKRIAVGSAFATSFDSFCLLYEGLAISGGQQTAGPFTFSNLGESSGNGTTCDASSVISLSSADVSIAGVSFTDVSGTITPTQLTMDTKVADGEVSLNIAGPYPDTGSVYSASAVFQVGDEPITATGVLDYSVQNEVTVSLGVDAKNLGFSPLPGLSVNAASSIGTFNRKNSASGSQDSFDLAMEFSGTWNPVGTVVAKSLQLDINNLSGDLVASIDTSLSGAISMDEVNLGVTGLEVSGDFDLDSGRVELSVNLGEFGVSKIAELSNSIATFVYDPKASAGGNSAFISGTATFGSDIKEFFAGETITATIEFSEQGYLLTADMESAPTSSGFEISSLQFVYTSLINPAVPFQYAPEYPGVSGILIPVANDSPLAIGVSKSLPETFVNALDDLKINVIDPNSISVIAVELPPGVPKLSVYYQAPDQPYLIGGAADQTFLRFNDVFLSVEAGAEDSFTIGGDVTLHTSGTDLLLESALTVALSDSGAGIDGSLELVDNAGWKNAFGISGLTVLDLLIQAGIDDGLPSFGVEASVELPDSVTSPLGVVSGSVTTFGMDLSATTPCAVIDIQAPASNPTANVISLDGGSLTARDAEIILAPEGCKLGQVTYSGFALNFDGSIRNVAVGFSTTFELSPAFSLEGSGYIGSFPLGSVQMEETTASISISDAGFSFSLAGGLDSGSSIKATGTAFLASGGGFTFDGEGKVFIDGNGSDVKVHATDCKDISCSELTDASFSVTGKIIVNGFEFDAAISADSIGDFDAKLTIPNQSHDFTFSHSNPKVNGKGTFTYTISVEVSNKKGGEIDFSGSVKLNSCTMEIVFKENCSGSKVTWTDKISTGSVQVTISVDISGSTFKSSLKL